MANTPKPQRKIDDSLPMQNRREIKNDLPLQNNSNPASVKKAQEPSEANIPPETTIFEEMAFTILEGVAEKYKTIARKYVAIAKKYEEISEIFVDVKEFKNNVKQMLTQNNITHNHQDKDHYINLITNQLALINAKIMELEKLQDILNLMLETINEKQVRQEEETAEEEIAIKLLAFVTDLKRSYEKVQKKLVTLKVNLRQNETTLNNATTKISAENDIDTEERIENEEMRAQQKQEIENDLNGIVVKLIKPTTLYETVRDDDFYQAYAETASLDELQEIQKELEQINVKIEALKDEKLFDRYLDIQTSYSNLKSAIENRKAAIEKDKEDERKQEIENNKALRAEQKSWRELLVNINAILPDYQKIITRLNKYELETGSVFSNLREELQKIVAEIALYQRNFAVIASSTHENIKEKMIDRHEENKFKFEDAREKLESLIREKLQKDKSILMAQQEEWKKLEKRFSDLVTESEKALGRFKRAIERVKLDVDHETGTKLKQLLTQLGTIVETIKDPTNNMPEERFTTQGSIEERGERIAANEITLTQLYDKFNEKQDEFSKVISELNQLIASINQPTPTHEDDSSQNTDPTKFIKAFGALNGQYAASLVLNKKFSALIEGLNATIARLNPDNIQHSQKIEDLQRVISQIERHSASFKLQGFDLPTTNSEAEVASKILNANQRIFNELQEAYELDVELAYSESDIEKLISADAEAKPTFDDLSELDSFKPSPTVSKSSDIEKLILPAPAKEVPPQRPVVDVESAGVSEKTNQSKSTKTKVEDKTTDYEQRKPINKLQVVKDVEIIIKELNEQRQKKGFKKILTKVKNFVLFLLSPKLTREKQTAFKKLESMLRDAAKQDLKYRVSVGDVHEEWYKSHQKTLEKKRGFFQLFSRKKEKTSTSLQDVEQFKKRNFSESHIVLIDNNKPTQKRKK